MATATRIALIGCGRWGRHILRDLRSLSCEVPVVARSEASRRRAEEGGASEVVDSVESLPALDGAVVATPTETHAEVTSRLLGRDIPVFVEKPLTDDPASAVELEREAAGRIFVMHKWRYHPGIETLGEIARSGELGAIVGLRCVRVGWGNPHKGVDAVWMLAPHDLSIALEVLGSIPPPRSAVLEQVGGKPTGLTGILGERPSLVIDVSASHPVRRREVRLICSGGSAVLPDSFSDHLLIHRGDPHDDIDPQEAEERPITTELPLLRELEAFVGHARGGPPPKSGAPEGVAEVTAIAELVRLAEG